MQEPGGLSRFLGKYPHFQFDLLEHIEASAVIAEARSAFESLAAGVAHGRPSENPWRSRQVEIRKVAQARSAYAGIEWSREDYEATIPVVDKSVLRTRPEAFLEHGAAIDRFWTRPTSGTSGPPVTVFYDTRAFAEFQYFSACTALSYSGLLKAAIDGRPVFALAVVDNSYLQDRIWLDPSGLTGATLRVVFDTGSLDSAEKLRDQIATHQPAVVSLKPNILDILLRQLAPRAAVLSDNVVAVISGGAELPEPLRVAAQQRLGVPIINAYGMTEVGGIASSCGIGAALHIHEGAVICEVLEEDGSLRWTGQGELVVSSIANCAMPILRYRTGDFGEITDSPCPCGRAGRRISHLAGRRSPSFRLQGGGYFAPTNLNQLFRMFPIREIQVTQVALTDVQIKVELLTPANTDVLDDVRMAAQRIVGDRLKVEIVPCEFQAGQKFQRYRTFLDEGISLA